MYIIAVKQNIIDHLTHVSSKQAKHRLKNEAVNALAPKLTNEVDLPDWNKDKDLYNRPSDTC